MPNPKTHFFEVKLELSEFRNSVRDPKILSVKMPVWTPGSYLVREFSRNIPELQAKLVDFGRQAKTNKVSKNEWTVETEGSSKIEIYYRVYAFEFSVNTSYLDHLHAVINGASVFVYVEGLQKDEGILEVVPFTNWNQVSTGLDRTRGSQEFEYSFPNFDILLDSPIEVGNQKVHQFFVNGITYDVSIFCLTEFDQRVFVSDIQKIVETTEKVFQDIPYKRYVFLVDLMNDNSFGGLEHLNSTHCIAQVLRLEPSSEYYEMLSLFSHEFFHAWNVKRMRPKGLGPFDYTKETYTKSLWIAEGITSYYDDLLIRRAGIFNVAEYLGAFSNNLSQMKSLPGSRWQSAQEASFDSWIKHYRPNENSPNVIFSYYTQGSVIGWMLDMEIRKSTRLAKNLDDVMRKTYHESYLAEGRGYTDEEFEENCAQVAGSDNVRTIFSERVIGRTDVDYDKYLGYAGLKLTPKNQEKDLSFLGVRLRDEAGRALVATVLSSSAAEIAGLSANDEILGVNGIRMDKAKLEYYLPNRKPGETVSLSASRQGALIQLEAPLSSKPALEYRISKKENATEEERKLFRDWLGAEWTEDIIYEDHPKSPTRTNVLDYI
jgi:predicted metalloprotease with PDZ domain